jgi:hypothetical protein
MRVDTDADVLHLREGLRDLVALSAIPAVWIGSEPPVVAAGLADTLVGLLQLDFAFVRLSDPGGAGAVEVARGTAWAGFPEWLEGRLATGAPFPRKEVVPDIGDDSAAWLPPPPNVGTFPRRWTSCCYPSQRTTLPRRSRAHASSRSGSGQKKHSARLATSSR